MEAPAPSPSPDSNVGVETFTPAPSPSRVSKFERSMKKLNSPEGHMYEAAAYILISVMVLASIMILRSIRHRTGWSFVKLVLRAFTYIAIQLLTYLLGVLNSSPFHPHLTIVWAVFIIVLAGSIDNACTESLEENEASRKRLLLDYMVPSILVFFILFINLLDVNILTIPVLILWTLYILRLREKKLALVAACRTRDGLDRIAKVIADFMKEEHNHNIASANDHSEERPNPITMQGYRYLVGVEKAVDQVNSEYPPCHDKQLDLNKIATVEDIWQCDGRLLGKNSDHLKDTCLSFAMFWLLLRRFAGYELDELSSEETRQKTWNFVRHGLIKEQEDGEEYERAFRVVEVELEFLYDYFFNNYFAFYCRGKLFLLLRVGVMASYIVVSIITLKLLGANENKSRPPYDKTNLEITITRVVIWILSAVELAHIAFIITSKWIKVKWVCSYVKKRWWETRWGKLKGALLYMLCHVSSFRSCFKPWQRQLGQYSLLDSYGHTPTTLRLKWVLDGYFELPLKGQKESKPVSLSTEVMKAVIVSLQTNGQRLSNGVASLRRNNVEDKLSWACENKDISTSTVLVWHIATSICEIEYSNTSSSLKDPTVNFHVANSLSKYCAYLVAFAPKLLPDHVYLTQFLLEQAVTEARKTLKHSHSKKSKNHLRNHLRMVSEEDAHGNILERGKLLGNHLMNGIEDVGLRWKVLADFWAEMILFLAPSNEAAAHAQYLVTGGQFITQLWALLTHAGIVDRDGHGH